MRGGFLTKPRLAKGVARLFLFARYLSGSIMSTAPSLSSPTVDCSHFLPAAETVDPTAGGCRPVSVLHLVNGEHFSGAERVQSHLGRCLPKYRVRADFACLKPGLFADFLERAAAEGRTVGQCYRTAMRGRFDLRVLAPLQQRVRDEGYQLLHAHTPRTALVASLLSRTTRLPWIYHVHSPAARDSSRWFQNRVNASIERFSLRRCWHQITVSQSLHRDVVAAGWPADRVTTIHNGVPAVRPPRTATPQPGGRWNLGMVALMRPRKGLEIALQAIRQLVSEGRDVHLRCIGPFESETYQASIERLVEALEIRDHVTLGGFAEDVPAALAQLDALLLPSLYGEGLPMVVLEAMAAALPVVATRVEGTPEAIRDGQDGLLAEPGSSQSLAAQIARLVSGDADWSAMAEAACHRHREHFSDQAMAAATAALYRRLLDSSC